MSNLPQSESLLRSVGSRMAFVSFGKRLYWSVLVLGALYAIVLLFSRLSGFIPDWFRAETLLIIPVGALLISAIILRRPTQSDSARTVDEHTQSKDLFLTVALLDDSPGEFKPLVARDAEERATKIKPNDVVPIQLTRNFTDVALVVGLLIGGLLFLPQFDPFGKVEAAVKVEEEKQELANLHRATVARKEALKKIDPDDNDGESKDVKKALDGLKTDFRKMKPKQKSQNFKLLAGQQKALGEKWKKISAQKLKELLSHASSAQKFGAISDKEKLQKWTRELQEGSTDSLNKEFDQLKNELEKLLNTTDPVKRSEIAQKIKKKLRELEEFASDKVNSKPLKAALQRAMKQLEMTKFDSMSKEAKKALQESMELAKMELKEIAQTAKDLKALEEALKAIQMAKKANDKQALDGEACENCVSMADYAELFAELGGMEGEGDGEGTGNPGMGEGGQVEEDDSVETGFKTERSKSHIQAGKVLLSLKTKGLSDTGEASKDYSAQIRNVKQGVSEAILQEKIPPGYRDGIRSYFDSLDDSAKKSNAAKQK